jgi:hypothetical protein
VEFHPIPVDYEAACQAVFDILSENEADLSKPTELVFYLYFPKRNNAELFAECLRDEGFHAEVHQSRGRHRNGTAGQRWAVVLRLNNRPEREFIDALSAKLEDFATKCLGEFDGWEVHEPPCAP